MNRQERRRLGKTAPDHRAALEQGFRLYREADLAAAEARFRQVLAQTPDQPDALRLLGEVLTDRGRTAEAVALLERLVAAWPRQAQGFYSLGNACRLGGRVEGAIAAYSQAVALEPGFAAAHHGLGAALRKAEREAEAAAHFREAVRLQPDWAVAWKDLGLTLALLGELKPAEAALARAVALQPALGDARRHLAALRDQAGAEEIAALRAQAVNARTPPGERVEMLFALGRLADKAGDFEAAFAHFADANALLRAALAQAGKAFDRERLTRDVDRLIAAFPPGVFEPFSGWGDSSEAPVFIVGMPRAGSTLFEQIAASHSQVFGAGEHRGIGAVAGRIGWGPSSGWTRDAIATNAAGYLAGLRAQAGGAARVIDKMPDNIFQLGLIAALLPKARVVFCERDARDLALSCFFQNFAEAYGFDTDLADIAFRIGEIERLKAHWLKVLPLRCLTLSYDALLAEPEMQARRLIGFLGLEWEAGCLDFHETKRVVRTASWAQVRRPLYRESGGRWKNYAARLGGLFAALEAVTPAGASPPADRSAG